MPWGEGDTPLIAALQLMRNNKYKFPGSIELEYEIPVGSDAVKEIAKCIEYARKALEAKSQKLTKKKTRIKLSSHIFVWLLFLFSIASCGRQT